MYSTKLNKILRTFTKTSAELEKYIEKQLVVREEEQEKIHEATAAMGVAEGEIITASRIQKNLKELLKP